MPRTFGYRSNAGQALVFVLFLLTVLALLGGVLVWSGSSSYAQTARAVAARRSEELARSALEEAIARASAALDPTRPPASGPLADWRNTLLDRLDRAMTASAASARPEDYRAVEFEIDFRKGLLSTERLLKTVPGGALVEAKAHFHGFRPVTYPWMAGFSDPRAYYREKVFGDDRRDPVPRDFQGYMTLVVTIETRIAGQTVARRFTSTRDVKVSDVTPPAREFTLFNFGPPPDDSYAFEDLNRGGILAAFPKGIGRVFVRGPLFVSVEDAAAPASFGGRLRTESSIAYPETGKHDWHGWAAIPGSRAVRMPNLTLTPGELFNTIVRLAGGQGFAAFQHPPQRPAHEMPALGRHKIPIVNMSLPGVFLLGLAPTLAMASMGGYVGIYQPLPPDEEIAVALNWAYLTGTVPRGKQTFSITGLPPERMGAPADAPTVQMYRGVVVKADGKPRPRPYEGGLDLPRSGYADGQGAVEDMDSILPEPFFFDDGERPVELAKHDHGVYGVYKIATYDRYIYATIDLGPLLALIPGVNLVMGPAVGALRAAGMMVALVPIHYVINGPAELTGRSIAELTPKDWEQYFFAPYGLHFDPGQNQNLWGEIASDVAMAVLTTALTKLTNWLVLDRLFGPAGAGPQAILASQKPGDRLSSKVASHFTGLGRDSAKVHGALGFLTRRLGVAAVGASREAIQALMVRKLLEATIKGAIGAGVFTATGMAMQKLRRAWMGSRLKGRNIGSAFQGPDVADLERDFPKGYYPPKYRPWFRAATRVYDTFEDFLADNPGTWNVNGVTVIRKLDFDGGNRVFTYRGRGVLAAMGEDQDRPRFIARVRRAEEGSWLTLAYENIGADSSADRSQLAIGSDFEGSIYASHGVKPAGNVARIKGNLITFHMNKARIDPDAAVRVYHETKVLPPASDKNARKDWWTVSISPRTTAGLVAGR